MATQTTVNLSSAFPHISPQTIAIGLDIGGTKLSCARVTLEEGLSNFEKTETPKHADAFLSTIETLVRNQFQNGVKASCLGIATAGMVNPETGEILGATGNLPALREIKSLKSSLEERLQLPVIIYNDAKAATEGEAVMAAKTHGVIPDPFMMVTLGTGVGTGLRVFGQLQLGYQYAGGEGGHICISMARERQCTCGKWDCWEAYASGNAVAETARRALMNTPNAGMSKMMNDVSQIADITTPHVIQAWKAQDPIAVTVIEQWHHHIATGLGSLMNFIGPEQVVIGGGMAQFVDYEMLKKATKARSMFLDKADYTPPVYPAQLGNKAGIMGAALLGLQRVH
jgi:glucokinase